MSFFWKFYFYCVVSFDIKEFTFVLLIVYFFFIDLVRFECTFYEVEGIYIFQLIFLWYMARLK